VITMYFRPSEHARPHFHARYGDHGASYCIETLAVLAGSLPRQAHRLVLAWAMEHRPELAANWESLSTAGTVTKIAPLE
jgi:hypothetical protein